MANLKDYWNRAYPECQPISHRLKEVYRERLVRFHSLPESKRYAETEDEYQIILHRHNSVLDYLSDQTEHLLLSSTCYSDKPKLVRDQSSPIVSVDLNAVHWISLPPNPDYPDSFCNQFVSEWRWQQGVFDSILRLVADYAVTNLMIISTEASWVFHPYDGGADVILSTAQQRDQLKNQFSDWLSQHPDGV